MEPDQGDDVHRRVLESTLDEVANRRRQDHNDKAEAAATADCCVICLENISEACEARPCAHRHFDYLCLLGWLEQKPECPLCKASVRSVCYGFDSEEVKTYTVPQPAPASVTNNARSFTSTIHTFRPRPRCRRLRPRPRSDEHAVSNEVVRRRDVYRHNRYSKHVGSNRMSRYRELNPAMFLSDAELVSRARMFIRRELRVFSFLTLNELDAAADPPLQGSAPRTETERRRANNAEFLLEYIIAILKTVDIMGSCGQAENMLADFLGRDDTRLFLHELRAWLRSPYTKLQDWDRAVQYDPAGSPRAGQAAGIDATETGPSGRCQQERGERGQEGHERRPRGDSYRPDAHGRRKRGRRHHPYGRRMNSEL